MTILDYIEEQMLQHGMTEEEACRSANALYGEDEWTDDENYDDEEKYWEELNELYKE